jgi:hypothetical protein
MLPCPACFWRRYSCSFIAEELWEYTSTWPKPGTSLIGSKRGFCGALSLIPCLARLLAETLSR